jgi:hypothetical protein
MYKIIFTFSLLISLNACKKNNTSADGESIKGEVFEYSIMPSATNSAISTFNSEHYVSLDTRTSTKNKLFVFLPGTSGSPIFYKLIVKKAAAIGYHSLGLMYPNNSDLYTASATSSDLTLFGKCRQEIFDGTDQTTGVSVDQTNCIKSRLYKLIIYLQQQHPEQNWQQFIINNDVDWSKCVVAGHSQGGGHALYIAKKIPVSKAISFASIDWNSTLSRSADWVLQTGVTPISKLYSFNSISDEIFNYNNVKIQLADMNFIGPAINIDNTSPIYNNSHTLITNATPALFILFPNHNLTVLDQYIPKSTDGSVSTTFSNAWEYLLNN